MRIAVDAMGGDHAPAAVIEGVVSLIKENKNYPDILLVGDKDKIRKEFDRLKFQPPTKIDVFHATEVIGMDETPILAIRRKKDSSILRAVTLVKEGKADAFVSAGNTGALVAATKIKWRSLLGVERPAIAVVFPAPHGIFVLLDAGATPDSTPHNLMQFAVMGDAYAKYILNIKNPKVGLLSFGTEEFKGTETTKDAYKMLLEKKDRMNFIGNIEGNDLFTDKVDVIACDGFMGNVILKVCESLSGALQIAIKEEVMKSNMAKMGALLMMGAFKRFSKKVHYSEVGGAPLLGVNGVCIKSHGRSNPKAIKNAIMVATSMVEKELNRHIIEGLKSV